METAQQTQNHSTPDASQNGKATASLVCGILGVLSAFFIPIIGIILSVVGLVLSFPGRKSEKKSLATSGMVLGIAGIVLGIASAILGAILLGMFS